MLWIFEGAKLVSYDVDIGEWVFETFHWSRYAMSDDDDDDNDPGAAGKKDADSAKKMPPPPALGRAGRMPRPAHGATSSKGALLRDAFSVCRESPCVLACSRLFFFIAFLCRASLFCFSGG